MDAVNVTFPALFAQRDPKDRTDDRQTVQVLRVVHAAEDPC